MIDAIGISPSTLLDPLMLAQHVSVFLESPYKPLLMYLPFLPWAWLVSSKIDKDARYYHLNPPRWNTINLVCGALALIAMLLTPIFWAGWAIGMILMSAPIVAYIQIRNRNVPEEEKFSLSGGNLGERMAARKQAKAARNAMLSFVSSGGDVVPVPLRDDPAYPVHMLAEDLLGPALESRATRVDVVVGQSGGTVSQIIDGVKYQREPMPSDAALKMVDYIKMAAGLDVEDRRRRQGTDFKMTGPEGQTPLSVQTSGSSSGVALRIEFDRAHRLNKPYESLGLLPAQREALDYVGDTGERWGIVLVGAPSGHGLTTSMYSLIGRHDAFTSNIKTLEREVYVELEGVDHTLWDPSKPEIDYATQLQSMLRRDPDVMMLDFLKDAETARAATEPGKDGPLIYVPQRQPSIAEQIREWVKLCGDVKRAAKSLRLVMNQRLLRTLCPNCRQAYEPTSDQLKKLGLTPKQVTTLNRRSGKVQVKNKIEDCPICRGLGYLGQTAAFEVFSVDNDARRSLLDGDLKAALAHARRNKMIYLQEAAISKVASGETTIEEVARVTAPAKTSSSKSSKKTSAA